MKMNNLRIGAVLLVASMGMSACGHKVQTQEWYAEHLDEADKRVNWCRQQIQQGEISRLGNTPESEDCRNAGQALMDAALKQGGQEIERMLDDMRRR